MSKSELTVTINAKLDVDRKTAETCLRLVEAYVNANGVDLICTVEENGEYSFKYKYPSIPEKVPGRDCKTCYGYHMTPDDIDNPCWNCDDKGSEWAPKE